MEDNTMWTCESKSRDGVRIIGYTLMDEGGNRKYVKPQELKNAMFNNWVQVDNLKLTRDGRLIDCTPEEAKQTSKDMMRTIYSNEEAKAIVNAYTEFIDGVSVAMFKFFGGKAAKKVNAEIENFGDGSEKLDKDTKDMLFRIAASGLLTDTFGFGYSGRAFLDINGERELVPCIYMKLHDKKDGWDPKLDERIVNDCKQAVNIDAGGDAVLVIAVTAKLTRNLSNGDNSVPYVDYYFTIGYDVIADGDENRDLYHNTGDFKRTALTKNIENHINAKIDLYEVLFYKELVSAVVNGKCKTFTFNAEAAKNFNNQNVDHLRNIKKDIGGKVIKAMTNMELSTNDVIKNLRFTIASQLQIAIQECIWPAKNNLEDTVKVASKVDEGTRKMQARGNGLAEDPLYKQGIEQARKSVKVSTTDQTFAKKASKGGLMGAFKRS